LNVALLSQRFAQHGNILREVPLLNERVRPHLVQQPVFADDVPVVFDQQQKQIENFGSQRYELALPRQNAIETVDPKLAKFK